MPCSAGGSALERPRGRFAPVSRTILSAAIDYLGFMVFCRLLMPHRLDSKMDRDAVLFGVANHRVAARSKSSWSSVGLAQATTPSGRMTRAVRPRLLRTGLATYRIRPDHLCAACPEPAVNGEVECHAGAHEEQFTEVSSVGEAKVGALLRLSQRNSLLPTPPSTRASPR